MAIPINTEIENEYAICRVSVAPLRAEASDRAEMVSQLLFGDHVEVLIKDTKWWLVKNGYDNYQGWIDFKQLISISSNDFNELQYCKAVAPLNFNNVVIADEGSNYHICPGSNLPKFADGYCYLGRERFKITFDPYQTNNENFKTELANTAKFFQNVSYLWGGRNLFGLDCSGFVQLVFKMFDIKLKRDASQQAEQGESVGFLSESIAGDVAFFDNEEGKITHVGILLSPGEIIHASSKVRIDPIDGQGIFNRELGKYTHKLRIVKRFN